MNDTLPPCAYPLNQIQEQPPTASESTKQLEQEVSLLQEMIAVLQAYERQCIDKLDLQGAKETRSRIQQLSEKEEEMRDRIVTITQDQKAMEISQEQEDLIHCFDRVWSQHLNELVATLAEGEQQLRNDQKARRKQLNERFDHEKQHGFKPSTRLANQRRKVVGLMKLHNYQEAEFESAKAKKIESEEKRNWQEKVEQRRKNALELLAKKAAKDFEVLRSKNEDVLQGKMNERDSKFSILLKKNQVKRIEASRSTKELMKNISVSSLNTKRLQ